jgi:hypothetical protein
MAVGMGVCWRLASVVLSIVRFGTTASAATPQQIDEAIKKTKAVLYSTHKEGHWEISPEFDPTAANPGTNRLQDGAWGGLTAMAIHALLAAGENANDP